MTDRTETTAPPTVTFDPPAPGQWELETGHHGLRPLSPFLRDTYQRAFEAGIVEPMQRYGLPLVTVQAKFVHGCLYMRPLAVGEKPGSTPKAPPPAWLMKLDRPTAPRAAPTRQDRPAGVHRATLAPRGRPVVRPRQVSAAGGEPRAAGGGARRARRRRARGTRHERAARTSNDRHAGTWRRTAATWCPPATCWRTASGGGSAPTRRQVCSPAARRRRSRQPSCSARSPSAIRHSGVPVASLETVDDVRALGPDARAAVDAWLEQHMWRTVTSDDVDRATLAEVPALQLAALLGATEDLDVAEPDVAAVRARVPGEHRALFDELLAEARYGHRQRDDIRGLCWNWPCGLVRRALLEAGRRLHAAGGVHEVAHVVELFPDELDRLLLGRVRQGADGPSADELAERAAERDRIEATPPPRLLGEPEPAPPLDVFPKALARVTAAIMANLRADVTPPPPADDDSSTVNGIGIGDTTYSGRACVVRDLMLAFDQLQPGDVLVAPFTGPSVNSLLPVIGALVVEEGGALCHSAIVAREFGLAAVIGAHRATSRIPHGAQVEVDPAHGTVRLL